MKCDFFFVSFMCLLQEVWTLCRILKRNASCKKYYNNIPDWREVVSSSKTNIPKVVVDDESCKTCGTSSVEMMNGSTTHENYVSSEAPTSNQQNEKKQFVGETCNQLLSTSSVGQLSSIIVSQTPPSSSSSPFGPRVKEYFTTYGDWDELTPVVEFAFNPFRSAG